MAREKICGIYCIENKVNGKRYIGQSIDIYARWWKHKKSLTNKLYSGDNRHLTSAWHKYGEDAFEFSIIERCSEDELDDAETFWVEYYDSTNSEKGYNKTSGGKFNYNLVYPEEEKAALKKYGENSGYHILSEKDVRCIIQKMLDGETNQKIAQDYSVNKSTIAHIRNHKSWSYLTEGIVFKKFDGHKYVDHVKSSTPRSVDMYSIDGVLLKTFPSIKQAAKEIEYKDSAITKVCTGRLISIKNLIFRYSGHPFNEFDTSRANITAPVSVDQYDENWVYLNTFHTMKEAQDITGISKVTIGLVVRGKQKMTGGYHWLRHGEQPPIININENKEEIENVI